MEISHFKEPDIRSIKIQKIIEFKCNVPYVFVTKDRLFLKKAHMGQ